MYGHRDAGFFGYSHFTGGFAGGQAEYVRVPKGNVNLLPIPDDIPDEKAIYLSDVLSTSYHCVMDTGVEKGDVVGVWVRDFCHSSLTSAFMTGNLFTRVLGLSVNASLNSRSSKGRAGSSGLIEFLKGLLSLERRAGFKH